MTDSNIAYKSPIEQALELYPTIKAMTDKYSQVHRVFVIEALYLLMQMVDGPHAAGRFVSSMQTS